jgi:glycosyltransferase involved in cell wall biosynthesis
MVNFERMNILIITHSYPDAVNKWRGLFIKEQARALSLHHDVTVVYFTVDYSRFSSFAPIKHTVYQTDRLTEYHLVTGRSFPVVNQVKYLYNTYRFIKKNVIGSKKFDVINSHISYPAGFLGTLIQKLCKIPNVTTEHSWIRKHFRSRIHKKCILYTLRNSAGYITVSKALREDIQTIINRDISVIPNVIDINKFSISGKVRGENLDIGLLGGMGNYRKGLDILIRAIALLKNRNVSVHVGGDGRLLEKFKAMAREAGVYEHFSFYGDVPAERTPEFYSRLDAFVLASRDETFGVVVIEAMASGLPVIATDCGGPKEIITEETGVLVRKEDPEELARAIEFMQENIGKYDRQAIRKYAESRYGQEAFVNTFINTSILVTQSYTEKTQSFTEKNNK